MESIKSFCDRKLLGYSVEQYIIMFVVFTLFLPYYFSLAAMVGVVIYLIYTRQLKSVIENTPRGWFALLFSAYSLAVSLSFQNYLGVGQSLGMMLIVIFILFYREHVNERLFTFIVDTCCLVSICCFIWGLMEYAKIVDRLGYPFEEFIVEDAPKNRINSTFYNANFYAMMIEFLVLMCIYKILHAKSLHRVVFYSVTILCNLFALYLTGCRSGWLSFVLTIPLMFFMNDQKKISFAMCGLIGLSILVVLLNPSIFPRFDNIIEYFFNRTDIWGTAAHGIRDNFIFGRGPSGYAQIYELYGGRKTVHSHSIYLDPFLSFGIVGVSLALYFIWPVLKEFYHLYRSKLNKELFGLMMCFLITIFVHGIFDYTVFWVQTGTVFLLVMNAGSMYRKKMVE